jgi:PAS domain S-box-containing protein
MMVCGNVYLVRLKLMTYRKQGLMVTLLSDLAYKVLIVDDIDTDREQYRRYLTADINCTYEVLEAASVAAGLELCRSQPIDVILLDYCMPDADGLDFLVALQAENHAVPPAVVMLTGQGDERIATKAIKLGAEDYLVKSTLTSARLQLTLNNAIASIHARRELSRPNEELRISIDTMIDCFGTYSAIRDAGGDIIDFRFDYLNAAALESNQMTRADMAKGLCELFPALRTMGLFAQYCQVVETGTPFVRDDITFTDVFGTEMITRAYEVRVNKLKDGFAAAWRDVTVQRQDQEERNRFFDLSLDLLAVANFEGYFLRVNRAWEETLGFTAAELMAQPYLNLVHPDDRSATLASAQELSQGVMAVRFENRYRTKDGSYRWLSWSARPYDQQNLIYAVAHDITDRRRLKIAAQADKQTIDRQLAEIEAIYRTAPIGLCFINTELQFVRINEYLATIDGFSVSDHIGKTLRQILPEMAAQLEPLYQQIIASGEPILDHEMSGATEAEPHVIKHWLTSYYPQKDSDDRVVGVNVMVLEITDRKQALAVLEAHNRELDSFAHIVSHDLKAPLRAVSNLSQWIEEDLEGVILPATQLQMTTLRRRVHRMATTIDGLLDYARIGRSDDQIETVAVAELLAETIDSLAPPPTFTIIIASNLPTLKTKRLPLSQVFTNLIANGIKHHDRPDGSIQISCQECGDLYEFTIADDGPGIDATDHDKIFAIFQAINPQNIPDSTGIGLSIVKKIVESEGGSIHLKSAIGQGATFRFTWPKL